MFKAFKQLKTMVFRFGEDGCEEAEVPFAGDQTVLEAALANKIPLPTSCGGMGTCGACRVEVLSSLDELEPRNETEQEMADERGFAVHERLGCQIFAKPGLKVRVPCSED